MSSILILPKNDPEPDPSMYTPLRQTRGFKYYTVKNNPNAMEVDSIRYAKDSDLEAFENAFAGMKLGNSRNEYGPQRLGGGKSGKSRKSRKSRKYRRYKK